MVVTDSLRGGLGVGIAGVDIVFTRRGGPLREKVSDGGESGVIDLHERN